MKITGPLIHDVKFQMRHGFYYAYTFVSAIYILALLFMPPNIRIFVAILLIFSDPGIMGFFFIGGIILLEKDQHVLDNLFVTPYKVSDYILSKTLSLGLLAVSTSLAIVVAVFGTSFSPLPLILGVLLTSFFFVQLGIVLAVRARSLNSYLINSSLYLTPFVLPMLEYLGLFTTPLFALMPVRASLFLIGAGFRHESTAGLVWASLVLLLWGAAAHLWARSSFNKFIINREGGGKK